MTKSKWAPEKPVTHDVVISAIADPEKASQSTTDEARHPITCIAVRKLTTYMLFLGVLTVYTQRQNMSVAIVAMLNTTAIEESEAVHLTNSSEQDAYHTCPRPYDHGNTTSEGNMRSGSFVWSETTQGLVLGAFLYGYIPTQGLGGRLAEVVGGKITFGIGLIVSTILSFLTPLAANSGVAAIVAVRAIMGIGQGLNIPTAYQMTSEWSLPEERSTMLAIALTGGHVGTIFIMPVAGLLSDSEFLGGWPSVFYVVGFLGCFVTVFWVIGVFDRPALHPRISVAELHLLDQVQRPSGNKTVAIPWISMAKSVPLLATTFTKMSLVWIYNMISTKIPSYLESVLHIPIQQNGMINALMYGSLAISMLSSAKLCDYILKNSQFRKTTIRKTFQFAASFGCSLCVFLLVVVGCNSTAVICLLAAAMFFYGLSAGGESPNCFDLAPALSGTISGLGNMLASITGAFAPIVAGLFLEGRGNSLTHWSYVFYLSAGFCALGGLSFVLLASGEEQPWANEPQENHVEPQENHAEPKENHAEPRENHAETRENHAEPQPDSYRIQDKY